MINDLGSAVFCGVLAVLVGVIAAALPARGPSRWIVPALAGVWIGAIAILAAAGAPSALPVLLMLFILPFAVFGALWFGSAAARGWMLALPVSVLIGLNVMRVLGVFFLILAAQGRLHGPFPYFAGIGDIIVAAFALPTARAAREGVRARGVIAWNVLGTLDLIVAVALGVTMGGPTITTLPWAIVPLVLVPFYLAVHVLIFEHQRRLTPVDVLFGSAGGNGDRAVVGMDAHR